MASDSREEMEVAAETSNAGEEGQEAVGKKRGASSGWDDGTVSDLESGEFTCGALDAVEVRAIVLEGWRREEELWRGKRELWQGSGLFAVPE